MILITGGLGYIGSHTVCEFLSEGKEILVFDNLSTGNIEALDELKKLGEVTFVKGDLRSKDDLDKLFSKYKISAVIHFAALSIVSESVEKPQLYYDNNVVGSMNLLNAMVAHAVKNIVFSSTAAVYGEPKNIPILEEDVKEPINPYGATKLMVESMINDYHKAYGLNGICLRYFNVIGASSRVQIGESHNPETHLVPIILKSVLNNKADLKVFGDSYPTKDGTCIRDYIDVEDLSRAHYLAYKKLSESDSYCEAFNLGTENGSSILEILKTSESVVGQKIDYKVVEPRVGDPAILCANTEKVKNSLGFSVKASLQDSIAKAYEWEENRKF